MKKKNIILSTVTSLVISAGAGAAVYFTLLSPAKVAENTNPDEIEEEIKPGEEIDPGDEGEEEINPEEDEEDEEEINPEEDEEDEELIEEETNFLETLAETVELYKDTNLDGVPEIYAQKFRDALAEAVELLEIGIELDDAQAEFNLKLAYIMLGIY